jgi:tetratricopeptide (TPR) repeat protein
MSGYTVTAIDRIEQVSDGRCPWRPVRHHLGITSFGVNEWSASDAGDRLVNEHDEADDGSEELYVVLRGRATFELDGERVDAPAGTLVYARPGVTRTAFAEEAETSVLALGAVPGKAYEADGWEIWAPLDPLYQAGDYAGVIERGRDAIEAQSTYGMPLYNLACCESLAGRTDDAIEHLRRAIGISERLREHAESDTDFDGIRGEPAFAELVGGGPGVSRG